MPLPPKTAKPEEIASSFAQVRVRDCFLIDFAQKFRTKIESAQK